MLLDKICGVKTPELCFTTLSFTNLQHRGNKTKKTKSLDFGLTLNEVMQSRSIIIGVLNGNPEPQHYQNARNNCNYSQFIIIIVNIIF